MVPSPQKSTAKQRPPSIRQSVTIPAPLAVEVQRVAKERKVTVSRALVTLAERGVQAEAEGRAKLTAAYHEFMANPTDSKAGEELITAIFGRDAIAKDPIR